ncbi:MAG TPA: amidohydrolase family protein [Solirubrobacteraceae bacterium]|nr:amidohydrolase family protein [Solirubrobacteraceae bacterium]
MYADDLLAPWYEQTTSLTGPLSTFDAHTHIGVDDPDTFKCTPEQLLAALATTGSRAAVFPMHEPGGYPPANDRVIATAAASHGRLVAFCRVNPREDPVAEVRRCIGAGARGIKLHPRAEQFDLGEPAVKAIVAEAHERRLPVLVHAGRGIPALGAHVLELAAQFPHARFILAHAGVCDLAWIWRRAEEFPNVFFDTAWFSVPDLLALFAYVAPGRILYATDIPFGTPMHASVLTFRCALQAGLSPEQIACVAGAQLERLVAGEDALDVGPAPGPGALRVDPLLHRVSHFVTSAIAASIAGGSSDEQADLARLACLVGDDAPQAPICRSILRLLELQLGVEVGQTLPERFSRLHLLVIANVLAETPDVPVG